jgi:hypothetical protein
MIIPVASTDVGSEATEIPGILDHLLVNEGVAEDKTRCSRQSG